MTESESRYRERADSIAELFDGSSHEKQIISNIIETQLMSAYYEGQLDAYEGNPND